MLCPLVHSPSFYTQKLITYRFPSALSTPLGGMPYPWNKLRLHHKTAFGMMPCPSKKLQRYNSLSAQVPNYTIINFLCKTLSESVTSTRFYRLTCVRSARSTCFNLLARGNNVLDVLICDQTAHCVCRFASRTLAATDSDRFFLLPNLEGW